MNNYTEKKSFCIVYFLDGEKDYSGFILHTRRERYCFNFNIELSCWIALTFGVVLSCWQACHQPYWGVKIFYDSHFKHWECYYHHYVYLMWFGNIMDCYLIHFMKPQAKTNILLCASHVLGGLYWEKLCLR